MAEDVQPMLAEVRDSGLLKEVDSLTRSLTQATEDLRYPTGFCTSLFSCNLVVFLYHVVFTCYFLDLAERHMHQL